jgi:hypothetical protein
MAVVQKKKKRGAFKTTIRQNAMSKRSAGFEKAWKFWREIQVDLSQFKFDREEANAR